MKGTEGTFRYKYWYINRNPMIDFQQYGAWYFNHPNKGTMHHAASLREVIGFINNYEDK